MDNDHHDHMEMYVYAIGDRISYKEKAGKVSRINIFGMRACCAIEVEWDDGSMKTILQTTQLKDVKKI